MVVVGEKIGDESYMYCCPRNASLIANQKLTVFPVIGISLLLNELRKEMPI